MPRRPEAAPLTPEAFARLAGVSRETLERLKAYAELLRRWQARINLVSAASLGDLWRRHMLDSSQLSALAPATACSHIDLGSGAGFPGLVLAILTVHEGRGAFTTTLVESDQRKCAFLREAARIAETPVEILPRRIEALTNRRFDLVTARALAPLERLLPLAAPLLPPDGTSLFLKGRGLADELTLAAESWTFRHRTVPSASDANGAVLIIEDLRTCPSPGRPPP